MATRRHQHIRVNVGEMKPKYPFRMKTVVVALFFVVAGLIALLVSIELDEKTHPVAKSLLREFATIAIIGGSLHVTYELFQRIEYVRATEEHTDTVLQSLEDTSRAIFERLSLTEETIKMGLASIHPDASTYDYGPLLEHTIALTIVSNDGRTWVSNNAGRLRKRLQDPSKKTRFFFLHPQSPMQQVLARKYGSSEAALIAKLNETLMMLADVAPADAKIEVFAHNLFNPHSVFVADTFAIVSPYFHSRTRRTVPALRFQDTNEGCFFREIRDDIESLMLDSETLAIPWAPPS